MSHHYLEAENLDLRRQLKVREHEWKKEKALLLQKIEQLSEQINEMEVRETQSKTTISTLNKFIRDMEIKPKDLSAFSQPFLYAAKTNGNRFESPYKTDVAKSEYCIKVTQNSQNKTEDPTPNSDLNLKSSAKKFKSQSELPDKSNQFADHPEQEPGYQDL